MIRTTLATALVAAAVSAPAAAQNNLPCYPIADIERQLHNRFGEQQRFSGRASSGMELRIYANVASGTWTLVGLPGNSGIGCFFLEGQSTDMAVKSPEGAPNAKRGTSDATTPLHNF